MISLLFKYSGSAVSQLFAETQYWVTVSESWEPISSGNRATYLPVGASIRWRQQSCKLHILSVIKYIADTPRSVRSLTRSLARSQLSFVKNLLPPSAQSMCIPRIRRSDKKSTMPFLLCVPNMLRSPRFLPPFCRDKREALTRKLRKCIVYSQSFCSPVVIYGKNLDKSLFIPRQNLFQDYYDHSNAFQEKDSVRII